MIASSTHCHEIIAGVFSDLSTAFGTLNHEVLFYKLEYYGIRGLALQRIRSYFANRKQFDQYNNFSSLPQTIKRDVFQGSIQEHFFFSFIFMIFQMFCV